MKATSKRCLELFDRVSEFFDEHATLTFGARGTALIGQVDTFADLMRSYGANQVGGFGEFRGGVAERRERKRGRLESLGKRREGNTRVRHL